jgi:cofilin
MQLTWVNLSRATVSQDCITAFNELKLAKKFKYIIFKLSDDNRQIVVEEASPDKDWENFRQKLVNATTKTNTVSRARASR